MSLYCLQLAMQCSMSSEHNKHMQTTERRAKQRIKRCTKWTWLRLACMDSLHFHHSPTDELAAFSWELCNCDCNEEKEYFIYDPSYMPTSKQRYLRYRINKDLAICFRLIQREKRVENLHAKSKMKKKEDYERKEKRCDTENETVIWYDRIELNWKIEKMISNSNFNIHIHVVAVAVADAAVNICIFSLCVLCCSANALNENPEFWIRWTSEWNENDA